MQNRGLKATNQRKINRAKILRCSHVSMKSMKSFGWEEKAVEIVIDTGRPRILIHNLCHSRRWNHRLTKLENNIRDFFVNQVSEPDLVES